MTSTFRFGNGSSKTNVTSAFRFGNSSSKKKLGVVNDNSFWTGDDDGMAQKYTDRGGGGGGGGGVNNFKGGRFTSK